MSTEPVHQPVSPIKASPTKCARIFYKLPKGDVLGQARLRICSQDEFSNSSNTGSVWAGPVTPKPKAARLTAVSSPTKHSCWTQQKNYSREELCNAISSLYKYKGGEEYSADVCADIFSAQQAGIKSYKAQSHRNRSRDRNRAALFSQQRAED